MKFKTDPINILISVVVIMIVLVVITVFAAAGISELMRVVVIGQ